MARLFKNDVDFLTQTRDALLAQGRPSLDEDGSQCAYRSAYRGAGCAIGVHMDDNSYHFLFEARGIMTLIRDSECAFEDCMVASADNAGVELGDSDPLWEELYSKRAALQARFRGVSAIALNHAQRAHDYSMDEDQDQPFAEYIRSAFDRLIASALRNGGRLPTYLVQDNG